MPSMCLEIRILLYFFRLASGKEASHTPPLESPVFAILFLNSSITVTEWNFVNSEFTHNVYALWSLIYVVHYGGKVRIKDLFYLSLFVVSIEEALSSAPKMTPTEIAWLGTVQKVMEDVHSSLSHCPLLTPVPELLGIHFA
jgi:hypothetical protein